MTQATKTYAYRSYPETLSSDGMATKHSKPTCGLFYKDTASKMDAADPTLVDGNAGLKARYGFIQRSKMIEMVGFYFFYNVSC